MRRTWVSSSALIALTALVSVPVTTSAGEWLVHRAQPDPMVPAHASVVVAVLAVGYPRTISTGQGEW